MIKIQLHITAVGRKERCLLGKKFGENLGFSVELINNGNLILYG